MFESDLLDRLSRVHPMVPPAIFLPVIAVLFVVGARELTTAGTLALVLAGWLFWTLTEYWLHRLVFHFEPEEGPLARFHWIIHGVHHDHPNDPLRLVMPPSVSIPLAAGFYGLFVLAMGVDRPASSPRASCSATSSTTWRTTTCTTTARSTASAGSCASCTCAITSRTTRAASASAPRSGTTCSARR